MKLHICTLILAATRTNVSIIHQRKVLCVMAMIKEFKEFAMRGNVVDMAVGIIIGGAFGTIVKSLVADVIMPPIGMMMGGVDFSNLAIALGEGEAAASINYGVFINTVLDFVIVAFAIFMVIRGLNSMKKKEEAKPAPPPGPSAEEKLLGEIRDVLKAKS